jgi:exodeoxyribonuclease III
MLKIATWNVNSIRTRKELTIAWLKHNKPDILLLQELKCLEEQFPREDFEDLGYNIALHGQKTFNGVAILSLHQIEDVSTKLENNPLPEHARYIEGVISFNNSAVRIVSVYVPNGESLESDKYQDKLKFFDALEIHLQKLLKLEETLVVGGDFNVAPEDIDTYSIEAIGESVLFDIKVRKKFRSLLNLGFYDAFRLKYPEEKQFSWWDYRAGSWQKNHGSRIDHILLSPQAADKLSDLTIEHEMRGKNNPSDHVPVIAKIQLDS